MCTDAWKLTFERKVRQKHLARGSCVRGEFRSGIDIRFALFGSAPGQDLTSASETLWGAVNAVTYYADHVRSGAAGERLDSAWFGAGYTLKEKAWAKANALVS